MSDPTPLLVPMVVEALVVNDAFRTSGGSFMRARMEYGMFVADPCVNAQMSESTNDSYFWSNSTQQGLPPPTDYYNGVYLKWRLPQCFTQGKHDGKQNKTVYPPVPNRWLIVRMNGAVDNRQASAWIVESDYVAPQNAPAPATIAQASSPYVAEPATAGALPGQIYIGRNVPLSTNTWAEGGASLHLTAVGPGNPAFAFYQPHNNNVFSFVDVLGDGPPDVLSYQVLGWFSDPTDDPLSAGIGLQEALDNLGWGVPDGTIPEMTLVAGALCGVQWNNTGKPAGGAPDDPASTAISIGRTSVEALTALVSHQAQASSANVDSELLEAFQLGLLHVLDEPDGAAVLAQKLQASFFQRFSGGYSWSIVPAPGNTAPVAPTEIAQEQAWLATLNQNQANLDAALRQLAALQRELYVLWWKYMAWPNAQVGNAANVAELRTRTPLQEEIDPTVNGKAAQQVAAQFQTVLTLAAQVPSGKTPEDLQKAIDAYAAKQQLPANRLLKRAAAAPFYMPNDPVVLISGTGASGIVASPGTLQCRLPSQLVTGLQFNLPGSTSPTTVTADTPGLTIAQPDLSGVSGVPWTQALVASLINEFFLIDPTNAPAISNAIAGSTPLEVAAAMADPANYFITWPTGAVQIWSQGNNPWHPLLLMWKALHYPIAYGAAEGTNWTFQDGRYVWNGASGSVGQSMYLSGLVQLSPAAAFNMQARISAFLQNNPNLDPDEAAGLNSLSSFVSDTDSWDLLSQSLDGFNAQLQLGMPGVFLSPKSFATIPTLADLIGDADAYPPNPGYSIPTSSDPASNFQPWRSGQFKLTSLAVVDEWGQAVWPIGGSTANTEKIFLPPDLTAMVYTDPPTPFQIMSSAPAASTPPAAAGPVIAAVVPNLMQAGMAPAAQFPITITGSGFGSDSVVQWNDLPLSATIDDDNSITAYVPANYVTAPGTYQIAVTSAGITSSGGGAFTVSSGAAIGQLDPSCAAPGQTFTLTATGVGFEPQSSLAWNGALLPTQFVSPTQLTAQVTTSTTVPDPPIVDVTEVFGHLVDPNSSASFIQLAPTLLQPARLAFELLSADGSSPEPVCGWVLPNYLDASLMAYDGQGDALGEMSVGFNAADQQVISWTPAPSSPYTSLEQISGAIPYFGSFLQALSQQTAATFANFLSTIDVVLWTTSPANATLDQSLAALIGRPLAMVRAQLQLTLAGPPNTDPSWQYTFTTGGADFTDYEFAVELGNVGRLNDGLIGYFVQDDYTRLNVVQQAGSDNSGYFAPIGVANNYIYLPCNGTSVQVSMLVDPRARVHATTAILPVATLDVPLQFVSDALNAMKVTFRVDGALTDQTTSADGVANILIPTPKERSLAWSWVENESGAWTSYPTAPIDATARLSTVAPVLRRGLLQLAAAPGTAGSAQNKGK